jgi:hypothetical protein
MRGRGLAAAGLAAALAASACGGSRVSPPPQRPPPAAGGYFVGSGGGGVGVSLDFGGFDPAALALRRALDHVPARSRPAGAAIPRYVGVVSIVNDSGAWQPVPVLVGVLDDARTVPLAPARRALGDRDDAPARRARAMLPLASLLPPGGSLMTYVVTSGIAPDQLAAIRMRVGGGSAATLRPQAR